MRMRTAKIVSDDTIGYLNFSYIKEVQENNERTALIMRNGMSYYTLWQMRTVKKHLRDMLIVYLVLIQKLDDMLWYRLKKNM